ncbi:MAG: ABC transporter permease [Bacteroidetes bacterium]|nr:MAG: ABC transporter permease [Bacteroidota bacterium]
MYMLITLAWRNLWRKKKRTLISVSSVMFAAILAIILMSMINGMKDQFVESIVNNTTGYMQIQDVLYDEEPTIDHALEYTEEIENLLDKFSDQYNYTVPRIHGFGLASRDMGTRGVMIMGIDPEKENRMNNLSGRLVEGEMFELQDDFAVIAEGLAHQLELTLGDTIVLLGQGFQGMTAAGTFKVGGIVRFPLPEQNNAMVYLPLKEAQWFFAAPDRLTSLIIMTHTQEDAFELAAQMKQEIDTEWYAVYTWEELMPDKVAAFEARDAQIKVMAWILYIVAGFGIFGTVITMMHERLREFGILLSIGLKRAQLAFVCIIETVVMSLLGVIAGVALGFPIVYNWYRNPISLGDELGDVMIDLGIEPVMSFSIAPDIFIYQASTIFFIALVVGIYPVKKIFGLDITKAARK